MAINNPDPVKWDITPDQTVAGQVKSIIDSDSPLMQQAATSGLQQANKRGLINSSMAVGATQDSLYRAATPIAGADAATNANAAQFNANAQNQFGLIDKNLNADTTKMQLGQDFTKENAEIQQGYTQENLGLDRKAHV